MRLEEFLVPILSGLSPAPGGAVLDAERARRLGQVLHELRVARMLAELALRRRAVADVA